MRITSSVGLLTFTKDEFHLSRVIDCVSKSLNCLANAFPLHRLSCQPNKPLKALGDTVSQM